MYCAVCRKSLEKCDCLDLQDRLNSLGKIVYKKCLICNQHYALCKCENPKWGTNHPEISLPRE